MSLEVQEGIVDRLTEKGVVLSGTWFGFSKHLKGPRLTEAHLGHRVTVNFHKYDDRNYIDVVQAVGEKVPGWKPPEKPKGSSWGGGGRRLSPEEIALKRDEGVRIARSVAIDRATVLVKDGVSPEKVAALAVLIEGYILTGNFSPAEKNPRKESPPATKTPPSQTPAPSSPTVDTKDAVQAPSSANEASSPAPVTRTRRPDPKAVNALFNEAKLAGLVSDWSAYLAFCRGVVKSQVKSPYGLTLQEFARVEQDLRGRLARGKVA